MTLATMLCLLPALGGCIASYSLQLDAEPGPPPDLTQACGYRWIEGETWFRAESFYSYRWGPPEAFGYRSLGASVQELPRKCAGPALPDATDATMSAYALEYSDKFARGAAALPMAYLSGLTLGFIPYVVTNNYAVCVEVRATDGLRSTGLAKGRLDSATNVWGGTNWRYRRGKDEGVWKKEELMRELAVHAWHKAWAPPPQDATPVTSCRDALDALAGQL